MKNIFSSFNSIIIASKLVSSSSKDDVRSLHRLPHEALLFLYRSHPQTLCIATLAVYSLVNLPCQRPWLSFVGALPKAQTLCIESKWSIPKLQEIGLLCVSFILQLLWALYCNCYELRRPIAYFHAVWINTLVHMIHQIKSNNILVKTGNNTGWGQEKLSKVRCLCFIYPCHGQIVPKWYWQAFRKDGGNDIVHLISLLPWLVASKWLAMY